MIESIRAIGASMKNRSGRRPKLQLATLAIAFSSFIFATGASAQTAVDAIRFSERQPGLAARALGMGGVGTAGLGDYSAVFSNPAGLGYMKASSFSGSLSLYSTSDDATYSIGSSDLLTPNDITDTQLSHLAYTYKAPTRRGSLVFALGLSQTASFSRELAFDGSNPNNSATDFFMPLSDEFTVDVSAGADGISGTADDEFTPSFTRDLSAIAYNIFAIDLDVDAFENGDPVPFFPAVTTGTVDQQGLVTERGAMHEVNIAAAYEASKNVMVGFGINIPYGKWELNRGFTENDSRNDNDGSGTTVDFDRLEWDQFVESRLAGVNLRGGVSFVMPNGFRGGLSVESPTYYYIEEDFETIITTVFDDGFTDTYGDDSSEDIGKGSFDYNLITPWRLGAGIGYSNRRFKVMLDAELIDWSQMEFDSDVFSFAEENRDMARNLDQVVNAKLGAEYLVGSFAVRAGLAGISDPRNLDLLTDPVDKTRIFGSLGFSFYPNNKFALDVAVAQDAFDDEYTPYNIVGAPVISEVVRRNQLAIGLRFFF